jgi:hypothetical protein
VIYTSLTLYEQETALWFNNEDDDAIVYTCNRSWMSHMDELCVEHPDKFNLKREIKIEGEVVGKEYICPKNYISVRSPRKISESQMEQLRERGKKLAENRK